MYKLKKICKKFGNGIINWFKGRKKYQRFIIGGVSLVILLTIVICCFTIDFSRVLGDVYSVEDIGKNIDNIEIGDKIDYTGNDFNNWQVLSINRQVWRI